MSEQKHEYAKGLNGVQEDGSYMELENYEFSDDVYELLEGGVADNEHILIISKETDEVIGEYPVNR